MDWSHIYSCILWFKTKMASQRLTHRKHGPQCNFIHPEVVYQEMMRAVTSSVDLPIGSLQHKRLLKAGRNVQEPDLLSRKQEELSCPLLRIFCPRYMCLYLGLSPSLLLYRYNRMSNFVTSCTPNHHAISPQRMEPSEYRLTPLNPQAKINLSLKRVCFLRVLCCAGRKLT